MNKKIEEILYTTKNIIKNAGDEVLKLYNKEIKFNLKQDNSPVTEADRISDEIILSGLSKFNIPILSEESLDSLDRLSQKTVWIIDSLDGTADFIKKTGEFSIMMGLIKEGRPIFGIVYLPVNKKLYFALKGKGSFLEKGGKKKKLRVTNSKDIKNARLVVSRNHLKPEDEKKANNMGIHNLKKSGSNGIKMGLIAEGEAEIFYNTTNKMSQWDSCGPEIILTEAGGKVTDIEGNKIVYNVKNTKLEKGLVATNSILHNHIINNLNR